MSRDGFGSPVPRQPCSSAYSGSNLVCLTYGIPPEFRGDILSNIAAAAAVDMDRIPTSRGQRKDS